MRRINVSTSRKYDVIVGSGSAKSISKELEGLINASRILIVTDDNVAPLYLRRLMSMLGNYKISSLELKSGEENKTMDSVMGIISCLRKNFFDRGDAVIALGGGVVGDISAFAASIYMRGIDFINIPTTLLSQVDSSVGGKTGVDFGKAKNIIGSFYQPSLVICDSDYLNTLSAQTFSDGCAEVIKYAFIGDSKLLDVIKEGIKSNIDDIIFRCVEDKNAVVAGDEFDKGGRAILNFGHTIGHAVESLSSYNVSHGGAVAIGMHSITLASERAGLCEKGVAERLKTILESNGLSTALKYNADELICAIKSDKKKSGDEISVIIPTGLCKCKVEKMAFDRLYKMIQSI